MQLQGKRTMVALLTATICTGFIASYVVNSNATAVAVEQAVQEEKVVLTEKISEKVLEAKDVAKAKAEAEAKAQAIEEEKQAKLKAEAEAEAEAQREAEYQEQQAAEQYVQQTYVDYNYDDGNYEYYGGYSETPSYSQESSNYEYNGSVLTKSGGVNYNANGNKETYYNLPMGGVVSIMQGEGYDYEYSVRDDGVKTYGGYVMVAAPLDEYPRGTIVETSLGTGIVCDTGYLESGQFDIAVNW